MENIELKEMFCRVIIILLTIAALIPIVAQAQSVCADDAPLVEERIQLRDVNAYYCCGSFDACTIIASILNQVKSLLSEKGEFEFDLENHSVRIRDRKENVEALRSFIMRHEKYFRKQYKGKLKLKEGGQIFRLCSANGSA